MRHKITYDPSRDYYTLLGVDVHATADEIRQAYRRCVREAHPDLNPQRADWATEQLQRVNEAYDVLREPGLRREYDRLRWVYVPFQATAEKNYRSPFNAPTYDQNRPWWEQVANQAPRGYPFADTPRYRSRENKLTPPYWLKISTWLKTHGLSRLEPTWLALVGLWRSPYAGMLSVLGVVLSINVAVIVYVFISPQSETAWLGLNPSGHPKSQATAVPPPTATPDHLYMTCGSPDIQIVQPVANDVVGDTFSVYGTVRDPNRWAYHIQVGYLGAAYSNAAIPEIWQEVRPLPPNQSIPEPPIVDNLLTDQPVSLTGQPGGYYAIRLLVVTNSGATLEPCDVVVRRQP